MAAGVDPRLHKPIQFSRVLKLDRAKLAGIQEELSQTMEAPVTIRTTIVPAFQLEK